MLACWSCLGVTESSPICSYSGLAAHSPREAFVIDLPTDTCGRWALTDSA